MRERVCELSSQHQSCCFSETEENENEKETESVKEKEKREKKPKKKDKAKETEDSQKTIKSTKKDCKRNFHLM